MFDLYVIGVSTAIVTVITTGIVYAFFFRWY